MRVTDLSKQTSVIRNVQNNADHLQNLQERMSSGQRINKLSDDPVGATQALDYRTKLSFYKMLQRVTKRTFTWLDRSEEELKHVTNLLSHVKTLALAQANDSADANSRAVTATEVQEVINALLQAGNAKLGKVYIFAGSKTLTPPLAVNDKTQQAKVDTKHLASDLKFLINVAQFKGQFQGYSDNHYVVRITKEGPIGRARYKVSDDGGKTWSREKTLLPQNEMVNESGQPSDKVMFDLEDKSNKLHVPISYPLGLEFTFTPNPAVRYDGNDDKREIPTSEGILQPINVTDKDIFFASPDNDRSVNIFGMLNSLKRALEDNDGKVLEQHLHDLDDAFEQVLKQRAHIGAVHKELDAQLNKIQDREFTNTKQLSELEDLDLPKAVTEMNMADVRNRASLQTSARMLQPSLLNFLR